MAEDCTWDGLLADVVWDFQISPWDGPWTWLIWGPDMAELPPPDVVWTPDPVLEPC